MTTGALGQNLINISRQQCVWHAGDNLAWQDRISTTLAATTQSAKDIANAARAFAQEDDITVLTLTFAPSR